MYKLSIIIATYNSDNTLRQTLDSIRHQTYKNLETIVIDGGSSDGTISIIKEYNDTVTYYVSEKDSGIYNAFNKGLRAASGDYVCFIGSDDCYINYNVFKNLASFLNDNINVLSTPIFAVDDNGYQTIWTNRFSKEDILSGKMIPHAGMLVKRQIMLKYMFNESNRIISDYEFLVRYVLDGGVITFLDCPIVYFSISGISSGSFGTRYWKRRLYEHTILLSNLNISYKYYENTLEEFGCSDSILCIIKNLIKTLISNINHLGMIKLMTKKYYKHKCSLKYCRWCKRY